MGKKRQRRTSSAPQIFERLCDDALTSNKFHRAIQSARKELGISTNGNKPSGPWWNSATKANWYLCFFTLDRIRNDFFGDKGLPAEYFCPLGAATMFVISALLKNLDSVPVLTYYRGPVVMPLRELIWGPVGSLVGEITATLNAGRPSKRTLALKKRILKQWQDCYWGPSLAVPVARIDPLVNSEEWKRVFSEEVMTARNKAYGRPRYPRRLRQG